jgi:hypothetical protein
VQLDGLDDLSVEGHRLLAIDNPAEVHQGFTEWVAKVATWLSRTVPDSGLAAAWLSEPEPALSWCDLEAYTTIDPKAMEIFRRNVSRRLDWLSNVPLKIQLLPLATPAAIQLEAQSLGRKEVKLQTTARAYVDPDRINEIKDIQSTTFDLTKLVRLCEEINVCFAGECYLAIAMLTRAILDHVPPIFDCSKFGEVANNYAGAKSFKESMLHLENSSRKISDQHLHAQIRASETLPTVRQVDFSNDIDVLLAEIVRILKRP